MHSEYRADLKAHVVQDTNGAARHIQHSQEYWFSEETIPRLAAGEYLAASR